MFQHRSPQQKSLVRSTSVILSTTQIKATGLFIVFASLALIAWGGLTQIENRILLKRGVIVEALHTDLLTKKLRRTTVQRVSLVFEIEGKEFETSIPAPNIKNLSLVYEHPILLVYDPLKPERVEFKALVDKQSIPWASYAFGLFFGILGIVIFLSASTRAAPRFD